MTMCNWAMNLAVVVTSDHRILCMTPVIVANIPYTSYKIKVWLGTSTHVYTYVYSLLNITLHFHRKELAITPDY